MTRDHEAVLELSKADDNTFAASEPDTTRILTKDPNTPIDGTAVQSNTPVERSKQISKFGFYILFKDIKFYPWFLGNSEITMYRNNNNIFTVGDLLHRSAW